MRELISFWHLTLFGLVLLIAACSSPETAEQEEASLPRDRVSLDSLGRPALSDGELMRAEASATDLFQELIGQAPDIEVNYVEEASARGSRVVNEPGSIPDDEASPRNESNATDTTDVATLDLSDEIRPSRAVFGVDDRGVPKLNVPYYLIGRLDTESVERPGTVGGHCTASLIGPRHIVTASHCFKQMENGKLTGAIFFPYYERGESFGDRHAYVVSTYYGENPPEVGSSSDYAVAVLDRRLGDDLGWFGYRQVDDRWFANRTRPGVDLIAGGYSGDWFQGHVMGLDWGTWLYGRFSNDRYAVGHDGDTTPGSSGGPVFARFPDGGWQIAAINVAGPVDRRNPGAPLPDSFPYEGIANVAVDVEQFDHIIREAREDYP